MLAIFRKYWLAFHATSTVNLLHFINTKIMKFYIVPSRLIQKIAPLNGLPCFSTIHLLDVLAVGEVLVEDDDYDDDDNDIDDV